MIVTQPISALMHASSMTNTMDYTHLHATCQLVIMGDISVVRCPINAGSYAHMIREKVVYENVASPLITTMTRNICVRHGLIPVVLHAAFRSTEYHYAYGNVWLIVTKSTIVIAAPWRCLAQLNAGFAAAFVPLEIISMHSNPMPSISAVKNILVHLDVK